MPDQPFETFLSSRSLFSLCQKEYNILVKNWIFDDPFHKKLPVLVTNYFGASEDQTIRIRRFFEKIGLQRLLRPVKLQRPNRSMRIEDGEVFMAWKITAKDFRII